MAEPKVKKKPSRKAMKPRTKVLVAGSCVACAILIGGMPVVAWSSWKANQAQQTCSEKVQELSDALPREPQITEDSIARAEVARKAAVDTAPCRQASAIFRTFDLTVTWWYRSALLVLLLSMVPWVHHLATRARTP